jgi:PEP-CTERM motif-containing protein
MRHLKRLIIPAAAAAVGALPGPLQAQVQIGDTVTCAVTGGGTLQCDTPSDVVSAGTEFDLSPGGATWITADFSTDLLTLTAQTDHSLNFAILNFQNLSTPLTGFSLLGSSGFAGFDASDISLTSGILAVDLQGTNNTTGGQISIALAGRGSAVPEPTTWAMMIIGFGFVANRMRSARRTKTGELVTS